MKKVRISAVGFIFKTTAIQFDGNTIFIDSKGDIKQVSLTSVISLSKTNTMLGNRYFWKLVYATENSTDSIEFRANTTLWNRNFVKFYHNLRAVNPEAAKVVNSWWALT